MIPLEPYFTGVCDHLLCKYKNIKSIKITTFIFKINLAITYSKRKCITKSNSCPICKAAFFQKELHVNKMIKEAILYVNSIIDLVETSDNKVSTTNKPTLTSNNNDSFGSESSLPDLDIEFGMF